MGLIGEWRWRRLSVGVVVAGLLVSARYAATEADKPAPKVQMTTGKGSYAVVVSADTYAQASWKEVVSALRDKHGAAVIVYPGPVRDTRDALAKVFPKYACFVARPQEAGRRFVIDVHRLMRALDGDPYTDAIWGILTGYEAADALRIAKHGKPLVITRALGGTGINLGLFEAGAWFSEGAKGVMHEKKPGRKAEKKKCPDDSTLSLVRTFVRLKPQVFVTSGHATERDWQIGYSYKNGQLRCKDGQVVAIDTKRRGYRFQSPNPKVFMPAGNCLIGHIPDRQCMAVAMMHSAGVYQMFGYTAVTWYGYGGWGVRDLLFGQPGRFSFAEAFYFNHQALLHRLWTRYPKTARINFEKFDVHRDRGLIGRLAAKHGLLNKARTALRSKDEMGLLWDRDTVAFYGDPAWDARLARRELAWDQKLTRDGRTFTFELTTRKAGKWPGRPVMAMLPHRVKDVKVTEGADLKPVITDNFILVPMQGTFEAGRTVKVSFEGKKIGGGATVSSLPAWPLRPGDRPSSSSMR